MNASLAKQTISFPLNSSTVHTLYKQTFTHMSDYHMTDGVQSLSKKDKRRQQIQTKLSKMEHQFQSDKDYYYRDSLVQLQYKLSSLHSGDNPNYLIKIRDFEELRDMELTRLRLDEEYQVSFINKEFTKDYEDAKEENEKIVDLVKNKLRDRILKKIKQLKEDKALIDIATSSTSSNHSSSRYHINQRGHNNGNSLMVNSQTNESNNGYNSGFESSSSFFFPGERRSRRSNNKRYDAYGKGSNLSNGEDSYDSGTGTNERGYGSDRKRLKTGDRGHGNHSGNASGDDYSSAGEDSGRGRILTDNPKINEFLYGSEYLKRKEKASSRYSTRGYHGVPGLKVEEINEDLQFLRNTLGAIKTHKKNASKE